IEMIEQRQCILSKAGNREPLGIAKRRFTVTTALQSDTTHTSNGREHLCGFFSVPPKAMLPQDRQTFACRFVSETATIPCDKAAYAHVVVSNNSTNTFATLFAFSGPKPCPISAPSNPAARRAATNSCKCTAPSPAATTWPAAFMSFA